jgi:hypothetical protein
MDNAQANFPGLSRTNCGDEELCILLVISSILIEEAYVVARQCCGDPALSPYLGT